MADKYESFTELSSAETEGDDFEVVLFDRGPLVVLAPHGGGIEPGTSEIATEVAGEDLSLYIFEGLKSRGNVDLHITGHRFDEQRCLSLMENAESALAVHGCVDRSASDSVVFVGGSDTRLRSALVEELSRAGFPAEVDTMLSGEHLSNVCNRARHATLRDGRSRQPREGHRLLRSPYLAGPSTTGALRIAGTAAEARASHELAVS